MSEEGASLYRNRLARERGTVRKDWGGRISVALAYPNDYRIGMSNLGFQVVYHLLNQKENVVAERIFLPTGQEMSLHRDTGKDLLSLESRSPIRKFDLVAFSLSFENDYPHILEILQRGGIPLLAQDRDGSHPYVLGGGVTTFLNPEPLAAFFDFFLLGEAETLLEAFLDCFQSLRKDRHRRRDVLRTLAREVEGLYAPSLYRVEYRGDGTIAAREPVAEGVPSQIRPALRDVLRPPVARSVMTTPETAFADRVVIEMGRGCGCACRFCAAGYVYRPPRTHQESDLAACVKEVLGETRRIGLLSPCVSDTPGIDRIAAMIVARGGDFSLSSLRADALSEPLLRCLKEAGQRTLTIAPEAGSERLRRVVNKHLTSDQIFEAVRLIASIADFDLRLYFIVGLPTESREDVGEILELVKQIRHHIVRESRARGRIGGIRLNVNCFVPKPFTPFQWFAMETVAGLKEKQRWLRRALGKVGGVKASFDVAKWAYLQTLLSMGDRRVGTMLLLAHEHGGDWEKALRLSEINPDFFVHRARALDETLPWDFIDHGILKTHLIKEYKLALKARESEVCHVGACDRCGVCRPRGTEP